MLTCTLQVNVTERDVPVARHVVPHQLRQLGSGVECVLISANRQLPHGTDAAFERFLGDMGALHPAVVVQDVDYSAEAVRAVADRFFGGAAYGLSDWKGTPIHAFLWPLLSMETDYYLHTDSDVLFGGSVGGWPAAAMAELAGRDDVVFATPLGGPPGNGSDQAGASSYQDGAIETTVAGGGRAYLLDHQTTRVTLSGRPGVGSRLLPLVGGPPARLRSRVRGRLVNGAYPFDLLENLYTEALRRTGLYRLDLLGSPDGAWSLHLEHKSPELTDALPGIIDRVERGDIPDAQRGNYDLNASLGPITPRAPRLVRGTRVIRDIARSQVANLRQR